MHITLLGSNFIFCTFCNSHKIQTSGYNPLITLLPGGQSCPQQCLDGWVTFKTSCYLFADNVKDSWSNATVFTLVFLPNFIINLVQIKIIFLSTKLIQLRWKNLIIVIVWSYKSLLGVLPRKRRHSCHRRQRCGGPLPTRLC